MAIPTLVQVTSGPSLKAAWQFIYRRARPKSRNTVGIDGLSINDFARDPDANLVRLSRELRHKQFVFHELRPHFVPKTNGKERLICVPTVQDRVVQRSLLNYLSETYHTRLANKISYGFIRTRTVQDAAHLACSLRQAHGWVFKTDVMSFFDRIQREKLADRIRRTIKQRSLHPLLIAASHCEVSTASSSAAKKIKSAGIKPGLGVRQGMPLSPFFANLILQPFDDAIVNNKYNAVRYADDLIFFADNESECLQIDAFCRHELQALGFEIPPLGPDSKSAIYAPNQPAEFLGLGLCLENGQYELKLMPAQIAAIRMELLQLSSIPELLSRGITLAVLGSTIASRIAGYLTAYECCTNVTELEHVMDDLHQKILRRLYGQGLKIELQSLSAEARAFLGLT